MLCEVILVGPIFHISCYIADLNDGRTLLTWKRAEVIKLIERFKRIVTR